MRLQPLELKTTAADQSVKLDLKYWYCAGQAPNGWAPCTTNNGNVEAAGIAATGGLGVTQNFSYDTTGRLWSAQENGGSNWSQTYSYDIWGNRAVSGTIWNPMSTPTDLSKYTNNQWIRGAGDQYDAAGNQTGLASNNAVGVAANLSQYDAENRMTGANIGNTGWITYVYDGEGRRVQKTVGTTVTTYVYDAAGQLAAEYLTGGSTAAGTQYLTADALGSTRMVANGASIQLYDYLPFGEDIPQGVGSRGAQYPTGMYPGTPDTLATKFTGKERDAETGLDFFGARYNSSAQGRFTSPDPSRLSAFIDSPQSWNMYTYAYNNPLRFVDKNGKWPTNVHNQIIDAAFPNLSPAQRQILKDVSAHQDAFLTGGTILGGQGSDQSPEHAMRAPGQSIADAEADYQNFVSMNEDAAGQAQINFWIAGNPGFSNDALKKFALALHAVLDSTSPAHAGFQLWDWTNLSQVRQHIRTEKTPTPQQFNNPVSAAQNAYNSTFFWAFGDPFVPRLQGQTPQVTEKICYTLDDGKQSCQ